MNAKAGELRRRGKIDEARNKKQQADEILTTFSLNWIEAALKRFFEAYGDGSGPYGVFHFESLHNIHLGVTRFMLLILIELINNEAVKPSVVFNRLNTFLRDLHMSGHCPGIYVNFSESSKESSMNGLFTSQGIKGFLEARNYRDVEKVLPFLGTIVDDELGYRGDVPLSTLFTQYVDILLAVFRVQRLEWWSEEEMKQFQLRLGRFKMKAVDVLGRYHGKSLCTEKFHMLDHLSEDIKRTGSVHTMSAGLYEHSHVSFKNNYRSTSKRREEALQSSVDRKVESDVIADWLRENGNGNEDGVENGRDGNKNGCTKWNGKAVEEDDMFVGKLRGGVPFRTIYELHEGRTVTTSRASQNANAQKMLDELRTDMGSEGRGILLKAMRQVIESLESSGWKNCRIRRANAGVLPSIPPPSLDELVDVNGELHVHVPNGSIRTLQTVVAARDYRNRKGNRQDIVMLRNGLCNHCKDDEICVWFGKCLAMISIRCPSKEYRGDRVEQYAFVKYFEVVQPEDGHESEDVMRTLTIRWERANEDAKDRNGRDTDPGQW